jgi:hypothetical protein
MASPAQLRRGRPRCGRDWYAHCREQESEPRSLRCALGEHDDTQSTAGAAPESAYEWIACPSRITERHATSRRATGESGRSASRDPSRAPRADVEKAMGG